MIRSDRGSHFDNDLIKEFLDLTGTPHNLILAYSSQENAIVKRVNKEVNRHLRGLVFDTPSLEHYAKCIPFVQRSINSSVNRRTNASPASILFGNKLDLIRGILTPHLIPTLTSSNSTNITDLIDIQNKCKTKYKMSPSSVRSEGGEAAAGYCLNSVSYRVDEAVKYNVLNSD